MKVINYYFVYLLISTSIIGTCSLVDPVSLALIGSIIGGISYLLRNPEHVKKIEKIAEIVCQKVGYCEGCEDYWIPENLNDLEGDLTSETFGQEFAVNLVLSSLKKHLKIQPERPLVLSFQGGPGTGKNFISMKILKNMFRKGPGTKYVKFYRSSIDFPEKEQVSKYKKDIVETIMRMSYECHRSIFVFDEIEKMPAGILDVISGFVNTNREGQHDYRRLIFILLSNIGSDALVQTTLRAWKDGVPREEMDLKALTKLLTIEAYNKDGGLYRAKLVKNHDISVYVPFLPLDRNHIVKCLQKEVSRLGQPMSPELVEKVLEEMNFNPEPFSSSGCKGVAEKASFIFEMEQQKRRRKA